MNFAAQRTKTGGGGLLADCDEEDSPRRTRREDQARMLNSGESSYRAGVNP